MHYYILESDENETSILGSSQSKQRNVVLYNTHVVGPKLVAAALTLSATQRQHDPEGKTSELSE